MASERILIVEDESVVALDLRQRLENLGYQVSGHASNGEKAVKLAMEAPPDLILMDIKLRGAVDGVETAGRIRSRLDVPVIFLTAYADHETLERAKVTGPFGYLLKPFDEQLLSITIEMALYKHRMERALRESEERYDLALQGANDGIWDWNLRRNQLYFSPRWKAMLGYTNGEVSDTFTDWLRLTYSEDRDTLRTALDDHLQGLVPHLEIEHRMLHRDGGVRWVLTRGLAVRDADGVAYRISGSQTDITQRKRMEEQLLHDAFHDTLTGLPNRALLTDRLERTIERARRFPSDRYAVLFLDLDRFKMVNDSLGHAAGDELLVKVGRRLGELMRASDTVARLGGDEYVVLLEGVADISDVRGVAARIQESLKAPFEISDQMVAISASIGIVFGDGIYERAADILRDADIAMYRAKEQGKACFEVFEPGLRKRLLVSLEIETLMRQGMQHLGEGVEPTEFQLYYQPILSLADGQIIGFEALLRWQPPGHPLLAPGSFIPAAEESGLIVPLGRWILAQACRQMKAWQELYPAAGQLYVSVNISSRQFSHPDLMAHITEALESSGLKPGCLRLELTENNLMENSVKARKMLEKLFEMGVQVCIDDFGSGYSSLSYLHRFTVQTIKIDRSFISNMDTGERNVDIVQTILQLARDLRMEAIAEGVETNEQMQQLKAFECQFAQGYLFSRPQPPHALATLLDEHFKS